MRTDLSGAMILALITCEEKMCRKTFCLFLLVIPVFLFLSGCDPMVNADFSVCRPELSVKIAVDGAGSAMIVDKQAKYHSGDTVTVCALADQGSEFDSWLINGKVVNSFDLQSAAFSENGNAGGKSGGNSVKGGLNVDRGEVRYTFELNGDTEVCARFRKQSYTVESVASGSGSMSLSPKKSAYEYGEKLSVKAENYAGVDFLRWHVEDTETGDYYELSESAATITVTGNMRISGVFRDCEFCITSGTQGEGTVERSSEQTVYYYGDTVSLTAVPRTGWHFSHWIRKSAESSGETRVTENPVRLRVSESVEYTAVFEQTKLYVSRDIEGNGEISLRPEKMFYDYGENVQVTVKPAAGWETVSCSIESEGGEVSPDFSREMDFQIKDDMKISALFKPVEYQLPLSSSSGGKIIVEPQKDFYAHGENVTLFASPSAGYNFDHWLVGTDPYETSSISVSASGEQPVRAVFTRRKLTMVIYMAADNNLESDALTDFNELESVDLPSDMDILVLLDRTPGYDGSDGDWTDTRLFQVKKDPAGKNGTIASPRLDCPALGLSSAAAFELNMADPLVLQKLMDFAQKNFKAENYALLMWGHGNGWRGISGETASAFDTYRSVALDETSRNYMPLSDFAAVLRNLSDPVDVIGFDTCFGSTFENAFELKDCSSYLVGTQCLEFSQGWDYAALAENIAACDKDSLSVAEAIIDVYRKTYARTAGAQMSVIDLKKISALQTDFDLWAEAAAKKVTDSGKASDLRKIMLDQVQSFANYGGQYDLFVDVKSLVKEVSAETGTSLAADKVLSALDSVFVQKWCSSSDTKDRWSGLSVYMISGTSQNLYSTLFSSAYQYDSGIEGQSSFVRSTPGWVPHVIPDNGSLIDVAFRCTFPSE